MADIDQINLPDGSSYNINNKVTQTPTTDSNYYELLFSGTADNTTRTEGVRKTDRLFYNPGSGGGITGKFPTPDLSKADNGVSESSWCHLYTTFDKNNKVMARVETYIGTDGRVGLAMNARNYNTSGEQVANKGLNFYVNKSGDISYSISDAAAFCNALDIKNENVSSNITITKSSGNWSVKSKYARRWGKIITITLEFNGTGSVAARTIGFSGAISESTWQPYSSVVVPAWVEIGNGASSYMGQSAVMKIDSNGGIKVKACDTGITLASDGTITCSATYVR